MSTENTENITEHTTSEALIAQDIEVSAETPTEIAVEATTETATPEFTPETQAEHIAKTFDIDLDFDNYSVAEDRAAAIRNLLSNIKAKHWLASLKDWIDAEGQVYYPFGEQSELGDAPSKRISWESGHALETLEIINDGVDTEIKIQGKKYLSLQKLPKGDEILLSHFNPEFSSQFASIEDELHANLKVFLKAKTEKQKAFQERFKK